MNHSSSRVLVLGHGEMGHAMQHLLGARHELVVWQRRPPEGRAPVDLNSEAARAVFILFCLPAAPHHELALRLAPHLSPDTVCLTLAKGLDEQVRTAAQALADALAGRGKQAVLYGPMIAEEILAGRPAFACAGSADTDACDRTLRLFAGSTLHLVPASDVTGLSWCGVLKNVYALLFGMADELSLGDNVRGYLAAACTHELADLVSALGGRRESALGLAGIGDLVTTATSRGSHHHALGQQLARGETGNLGGEGLHTLRVLERARPFDPAAYPLFHLASECARLPRQAAERVRYYFESLSQRSP